MTKEQFDQMLGALNGLGTKIDGFSTKLEAKPETTAQVTDPAKEEKTGISAEQFSKLEETLNGLASTVGELKGQVDKFSAEVPGQRPGAIGGDDTTYQVC